MTDTGKAWMRREGISKLSMKALLEESSISWLQTSGAHKEDQVYALMGIASDADKLGINIDYSKPWAQVYTEVVAAYLRRGNLWFLNYCQAGLTGRSGGLPTWVPDWSEGFRGARVSAHWSPPKQHLGTLQSVTIPNIDDVLRSRQLSLRGVLADEVSWVSTERPAISVNQLSSSPHRAALSDWMRTIVVQCRPHTKREIWDVLICGSRNLPLPEKHRTNTTEEQKRVLLDNAFDAILAERHDDVVNMLRLFTLGGRREEDPIVNEVVMSFLRCFMQATGFKCVFRTKNGRLGLAPAGIGKGDRVAVFMGNDNAFVLRPVTRLLRKTHWKVMCEAYVQGVMTDEKLMKDAVVEDLVLE